MTRRVRTVRAYPKAIGTRPKRRRHLRIERRRPLPPGITSQYEARTWLALTQLGYTPQLQRPFRGGTDFTGGMRVDFLLPAIMTVVRVQSWWHNDPGVQARDVYQKTYLQGLGYIVVDVPGDDLPTVGATIGWLRRNLGRPTA